MAHTPSNETRDHDSGADPAGQGAGRGDEAMNGPVIRVMGLGKKYRLEHLRDGQHYTALRDVLTRKIAAPFRALFGRGGQRQRGVPSSPLLGSPASDKPAAAASAKHSSSEEFWALKDVSFEINRGEVVGIIGRNGAGKSTLLKILSRITEPTEGRAEIKGRVSSLLEVGTGFHPELTGRENIFLNGAILGMQRAEIKRNFDRIVAFAEIDRFLDTPVKRYSSGMYVRLAFAVAAHLEPEILIVDEVLAVGDAAFQKKCLGKMGDVAKKEGRTVVFVSHNMPMVEALCDRVILLERGAQTDAGPPDRIIRHYLGNGFSSALGITDLSAHPGRRNSRERALLKVWVETEGHQIAEALPMGREASFCFSFRSSVPLASPVFGFGVEDSLGRRIFSLNNVMTGATQTGAAAGSQGTAKLHLPRNPLLPGSYFLSVSLMDGLHTWVDFVEQALAFTVEPADVYGTGRIPEASQGVVFVHGEILVQAGEPASELGTTPVETPGKPGVPSR